MNDNSIDVIIPLYKGRKYIDKQIEQIDKAAKEVDADITLCFSNDYPDEEISGVQSTDNIKILYLNSAQNNGIQVARINGLKATSGEYVHFLDQDDIILPDFYLSQLNVIGYADATYCRCYNGNHQTYNNDRIFEKAFDKYNILSVCPVISPGQLLIKRSAIPTFWENNILNVLGADDYLLWLSMYANKCTFVPNQQILFKHVRNGDNYSSDIIRNKESDEELVNLLLKSGMLTAEECELLEKMPQKQLLRRYTPQRKDQIVLQYLSQLLKCYEYGITLEKYFLNKNVVRIAIFGAAVMGERIKGLLKKTKVEVVCFIDRNAEYIDEDIPVHTLQNTKYEFDAILLSQIDREEELENEIRMYSQKPIYRIRKVVEDMVNEIG